MPKLRIVYKLVSPLARGTSVRSAKEDFQAMTDDLGEFMMSADGKVEAVLEEWDGRQWKVLDSASE